MEQQANQEQVSNLFRRQRHSFLNHLQVISGWLQLGRTDKARAYLDGVAARIAAESEAMRNLPVELGLMISHLFLEAETYGVALDWRFTSRPSTASGQLVAELEAAVIQALKQAAAADADDRRIQVVLSEDGFAVHTPSDKGER